LISEEELGKRYYNLRQHKWGHWSTDKNSRQTVADKIRGNKNRFGKQKSPEECAKISKGLTGKIRTLESRKKQAESLRGYKQSAEHILKKKNANIGKKRELITCPHCRKNGGINMMKRWHFDKCQFKENII
jgi:hypothetical protein